MRSKPRVAVATLLLLAAAPVTAAPYHPERDDEVLLTLARVVGPRQEADLARLERYHEAEPLDAEVAEKLAVLYLSLGRTDGDPRYYGMAQAVVMPWSSADDVPVGLMEARAEIQGFNHDFAGALHDYDQVLARTADRVSARLARAVLLTVIGEVERAAADCERLDAATEEGVLCRMTVVLAKGDGAAALALYDKQNIVGAAATEVAAEAAELAGDFARSERLFRESLTRADRSFTRVAFADSLLRQGRARDALDVLPAASQNLGVMVRRGAALAIKGGEDEEAGRLQAALEQIFALERERGDDVHGRELALFLLAVKKDPKAALPVARANWNKQRERIDALLLEEAAKGGVP